MKDFLSISDYSSDEIQDLLDLAVKLKKQYFKKGNKTDFQRQGAGDDLPEAQPAHARFV